MGLVNLKYCIWAKVDIRLKNNDRLIHSKGQVIEEGVVYGFKDLEEAKAHARALYHKYRGQTVSFWWLNDDGPSWPQIGSIIEKYTNHEILSKRQKRRKPYGVK